MTAAAARTAGFYALHLVYFPALIGLLHLLPHTYALLRLQPFERLTGVVTLLLAALMYVAMGYGAERLLRRWFGDVQPRQIIGPGG